MDLSLHLNSSLPVFTPETSLVEVLSFFKSTTYTHIAVAEGERFLGMLPEHDLRLDSLEGLVDDLRTQLEFFTCYERTIWLEVLEVFAKNDSNLVAVLNENQQVIGYYTLEDTMNQLVETPFLNEPGGIIVVAKGIKDYSMSEVSQIVESNNSRVLGAFITNLENDLVQVTLKVSGDNFNEILQTFRRYGYQIDLDTKDDLYLEELKERSAYLSKFLNV